MLGIDRHAARCTFTAILVVLGMYLVYLVRQTLFIFILALLFAYVLTPLVNILDRFLPVSRTRTPALALAYLIFVGLAVFLGIQIGSRVVDQAKLLAKDLPPKVVTWVKTPSSSPTVNAIKDKVLERVETEVGQWSTDLLSALPQAGMKFLTVASNLIFVVIIPVLAFFFLQDGQAIRDHLLEMVEAGPRRALLDDVLADTHLLLAHYMRAQALMSLAAFAAYGIFFSIIGVPYGILLAAIACLLEIIPMIGPLTASVAILAIAGVADAHVLAVLIFLVVYRMAADYGLSPHLMGHGVQLHPLLVLFGVFAGAEVAGVAGTFISVPVLALVRIVYLRIRKARLTARMAAHSAPTHAVTL
ncbi:MAG: AI-2E family transporter [Acidobacteriia bacterium]|nr:AI-2E family transporter [Terriglobia bacterium]